MSRRSLSDEEIRIECLRIAASGAHGVTLKTCVQRAQHLEQYVRTGKVPS